MNIHIYSTQAMRSTTRFRVCMLASLLALIGLAGCGQSESTSNLATETVQLRDWSELQFAPGMIESEVKTPLLCPGQGWERLTITNLVPEGIRVKKGDRVATLDAPKSRNDYQRIQLDLQRKSLLTLGVEEGEKNGLGVLKTEQQKLTADLAITEKYVKADTSMFARNKVLDDLQDAYFLQKKASFFDWKGQHIHQKTQSEFAVINSQKQSLQSRSEMVEKSIKNLEIEAESDGILVYAKDWNGNPTRLGGNCFPGREIAYLQASGKLIAKLNVPETQAFGVKVGAAVNLRLNGSQQSFLATISNVPSTASELDSDSPVKYLQIEVALNESDVQKYNLMPGQALDGEIQVAKNRAITVPNIAIKQNGNVYFVQILKQGKVIQQTIQLGHRGNYRSEVKSGLEQGMELVIVPSDEDKQS